MPVPKKIFIIFFLIANTNIYAQNTGAGEYAKDSIVNFDETPSQIHPVLTRKVQDSIVNKLKNDDAYWYANAEPQTKPKQKQNDNASGKTIFDQGWVKTLFWFLIAGGFAAAVIWYLASSNIRLFRKPSTVIATEENELTEEDIFSIDYEKEIENAIDKNNYRLAIRLLYLRTLKELSEQNIIQYKQEKTNSEYLVQLSGTRYYKTFFQLTRDFEYAWYGQFQVSHAAFATVQNEFSSFKQQLH